MSMVSIGFLFLRLVVIVMLVWGSIKFEITSYYTLLKWLVFIIGFATAFQFYKLDKAIWIRALGIVVFGGLAILFNPIFVIHLNLRSLWSIIDIVAAVFFLISIIVIPK